MESKAHMATANHIFYLKYGNHLPEDYFHFSRFFSYWNITLVPVTPKELINMSVNNNRQYILSSVTDLKKRHLFNQLRDKWLDFALLSKRYCLYDVSSFGKFETAYQVERIKMYHHFKIPINMEEIVQTIAVAYFEDKNREKTWPGGKRAKLPAQAGNAF
jgi:hypothetical protein